jgi:autotransporter-associated beta strand protein
MRMSRRSKIRCHFVSGRRAKVMAMTAAVAGAGLGAGNARATYTDQNTYNGSASTSFVDPTQWSTGAVPGANELIVFPDTMDSSFSGSSFPAGNTVTAYGIASSASFGGIASGGILQLISTDTTSDGATTAPALQVLPDGSSNSIDLKNAVVLGNAASSSLQIATFDNTVVGGSITLENKLSEFAGSTWGVNITGTAAIVLKIPNYFTGGFAYSGDTTIASGAALRVNNNVLPHGAGRGNVVVNGTLALNATSNSIIINGLSGASSGVVMANASNGLITVGANDATAQFDGKLGNSLVSLTKVGAGTQTLTNSANANAAPVSIDGGVLSVTSIANLGTPSALGTGSFTGTNAGGIILDGGVLQYIGSGDSSDRLFTINAAGGGLDASGSGAINLTNTGSIALADLIRRPAEVNTGASGTEAIFMPQTSGVTAGMTVTGGNLPSGTVSVVSVDSPTQITVNRSRTTAITNFAGADTLTFTPSNFDRTLTLSGTNTGNNTLSAALGNSAGGGKLSISKLGTGTWVLNGANTYTGGTTVSAGTLKLGNTLKTSTSINVASGAALVMTTNGSHVLFTPSLTIAAGGTLDLNDNDLVVDYTGASPWAKIKALLTSGFNNGNENGPGIISSAALVNGTGELGYAENSDVNLANVDGVVPDQSAVIVKYTYFGDTNLDGSVTTSDFQRFLDGFTNHGSTWTQGDFTYDGKVDLGNDFELFLIGYLSQGGALGDLAPLVSADTALSGAQKAMLLSAVPEPTMIGMGAMVAVGMMARRRRK